MRDGTWDAPEGAPNRSKKGLVATIAIAAIALVAVVIAFQRYGGEDDPLTTATTSGTEPLVDPDDIISGGPPPDGIPPIDEPKFLSIAEVDFLEPQEPVVSLVIEDDARAYPLQIMTWHEIANDTVGGVPVTVTFCPLCNTAYAFEQPEIEGEITTFGTSGKLYNSNLVMYDRATESLWPQALGQAVIGPLTGTTLERVPSQIVSWEEFRTSFPDGKVLSRDTGHVRSYGRNPYPGYDEVGSMPFLFKGEVDGRLAAVERILGVETENEKFAFPYFALEKAATDGAAAINSEVGGVPILVVWKAGAVSALDDASIAASKEVGAAFAFSRAMDGRVLSFDVTDGQIVDRQTKSTWNIFGHANSGPLDGQRLEAANAHDSFWFDWAAFHPDTRVWGGE
ncbi:MAG: DUF3179 domain-containing protein [Actinomycetota bacterium]